VLRFVADENLNNGIVRGLRRRCPSVDLVRVQDIGLVGADDPAILDWAAKQGRVVLTHDVSTMTAHAYERVLAGQPMRGVIEVPRDVAVGRAIDDLALLVECAHEEEFEGQVRYLPL